MTTAAQTRDHREVRPWGAPTAALVSALLFLMLPLLPGLGFFFAALSPFPLVIQRLRGVGHALVAGMAATILITALVGLGHAASFVLMFAAPAWLIGESMVRGHGLRRGCTWAFLLISVEIGIGLAAAGPDFVPQLVRTIEAFYTGVVAEIHPTPEQLELITAQSKSMQAAMSIVYPAAFIIMGGLLVVVNAVVVRGYLARRDPAWLDGSELEGVRWPFGLAVVFVAAGLSVLSPPLRDPAYNVLLVLGFLMTLQGMSVVLYYARRLAGPLLFRGAVVALVIVTWARYLLPLVGLFDLWFDFRRFADVPDRK
jgi:uncharacterized protein YybS (DUF2232 family)